MYIARAEKIVSRINELAAISEDSNGVTRTFATKAFIEGQQKVKQWMQEAGLQVCIDNIGNVRGRLLSENTTAKTLVIASHIDTVVNAGKFDGPLGVLLGLDLIEGILQSKTQLPFHIELIAFSDEEGVRFHTTYLGSKVVAGSFDDKTLSIKDSNQVSLQEAIESMGGIPSQLKQDAIDKKDWLGYFEIHIEQGPVLWERDIPVAVVTAIAGQKRVEVSFKGMAGHAGTVPMNMRQDALCAAAEFVIELEKYALAQQSNLVATVGKLNIPTSASNVIAGDVICSVDIRCDNSTILQDAYHTIQALCEDICTKRNIEYHWNLIQETQPVLCSEDFNALLGKAITTNGYELVHLVSGAGHDAVPVAQVAPVCMLFVRCFKGISHNPLEDAELKDIAAAIEVSAGFITQLKISLSK